MHDAELFQTRVAMVQAFLRKHQYDGILLSRADNFAMATGGARNYVNVAADGGASSLFIDKDGKACFVGNNIEQPRMMAEELNGLTDEVREFLWFEDSAAALVQREFGGVLVSDDSSVGENVHGQMDYLRSILTETEMEKYRRLGQLAAEAMSETIASIESGQAEADIAARLIAEGAKRRCTVMVRLVAADDRIGFYRHPLPTVEPLLNPDGGERKVRGYVMVVGVFRREGLVTAMTRFKRVGDIPGHIPEAYERICGVDALMQEATEPGKTLGDVFAVSQQAYADLGFPENEWHNHHQGGTTGYAGRTAFGAPGATFPILSKEWEQQFRELGGITEPLGQVFAWNPSAVGVKSEDTFLLLPSGQKEIVTATPDFPQVDLNHVLGRATAVTKSGIVGC